MSIDNVLVGTGALLVLLWIILLIMDINSIIKKGPNAENYIVLLITMVFVGIGLLVWIANTLGKWINFLISYKG